MPFSLNPLSGLLKSAVQNIEHALHDQIGKAFEIEQQLERIVAKIDKDKIAELIAANSDGKISHAEALLLVNGLASLGHLAAEAAAKLNVK